MERDQNNCRFYKNKQCDYFGDYCDPKKGRCARAYSSKTEQINLGYEKLTRQLTYKASELSPEDFKVSEKIDLSNDIPDIWIYRGYLSDDIDKLTTKALTVSDLKKIFHYHILVIYNKNNGKFYMPLQLQIEYLKKGYIMRVNFQYATISECTDPIQLDEQQPMSILKMHGYTVGKSNGLPEFQRHNIIKFLIDNNIMKPHDIISLLQYFINLREGSDKNFDKAIREWRKDLGFTANYAIKQKK